MENTNMEEDRKENQPIVAEDNSFAKCSRKIIVRSEKQKDMYLEISIDYLKKLRKYWRI